MFGGVDTEAPEARFGLSLDPKTSFKGSTWSAMGWQCPWLCPKKVVFCAVKMYFLAMLQGHHVVGYHRKWCHVLQAKLLNICCRHPKQSKKWFISHRRGLRIQSAPPKSEVPTSPLRGQWSGHPATVGKWKNMWQNEWLSFFFICIINKIIQDQHVVLSLTSTFGDALGQLTVCVSFTYRLNPFNLILFDSRALTWACRKCLFSCSQFFLAWVNYFDKPAQPPAVLHRIPMKRLKAMADSWCLFGWQDSHQGNLHPLCSHSPAACTIYTDELYWIVPNLSTTWWDIRILSP